MSAAINFGKDHPFGETTTEESVSNIKQEDLVSFYQTWFKPNIATLVVVGDITKAELEEQSNRYFGSWAAGEVPEITHQKPIPPAGNRVIFVPLEGAVQSVVKVTYPVEFNPANEDYLDARVMNAILGGGSFSARLMQNIREDKAYTYSAGSRFSNSPEIGSFSAQASVRNEVTDSTVTEFIYELTRIATEPVDSAELQVVKNNMNGMFALSLERASTIAQFALNQKRYQLSEDYYRTYLSRLEAVNIEDVRAAGNKYILPNNLNIVVVGNRDVAESLAQFASSGEVEFYDYKGDPLPDKMPVPEGITTEMVLQASIEAQGGVEKLGSVTSYTKTGTLNQMGMALTTTRSVKDGDKMYYAVAMGETIAFSQTLNGDVGFLAQGGMNSEMDEPTRRQAKMQIDLLGDLHYADYGFSMELTGMELKKGKALYVIEVKDGDDLIATEYYDPESGLKLYSTTYNETPMGLQVTQMEFMDYQEFSGILFPKMTTISVAQGSFTLEMESFEINPELSDDLFKIQ